MKLHSANFHFEPAAEPPVLKAGAVHLWSAHLHDAPAAAHELLSAAEWARACRFHFDSDRARYIAARALLRTILAPYADCGPCELGIAYGPQGKPRLEDSMLRFNLSHSGNLLLLAVTFGREIGVDVEEMRDNVQFQILSDHYFDPADAWELRLLDPGRRAERFYEIWTRTEAQLKAAGSGLAHGMMIPNPERWKVLSFTPAEGYAGALAVEGGEFCLESMVWRGSDRPVINRSELQPFRELHCLGGSSPFSTPRAVPPAAANSDL